MEQMKNILKAFDIIATTNPRHGLSEITEEEYGRIVAHELTQQYLVKVNIPVQKSDLNRGNGEGMWAVILTDEDKAHYDADQSNKTIQVLLANDSIHWSSLRAGRIIQVNLNGESRPTLDVQWLDPIVQQIAGTTFTELLES
ncbi:hypothetical protein NVP1188A_15 [Vibrio phage 1.188.A._10N.286.51.A6]|uniref:Uncharacterized protein n=4 Tax=Mukerjeevirus TaxID=2733146 RepID=A0A2I7REG6_9CAUD|nr:hypothetical protein HOU76_gp81 [Vibrio phage 1.169.O._10N.261.52.B1]YP_009817474.1 hypothetical protein HOU77_gp15 [Vibrio phage 1.188.A._10N.286.51.A6]AUR93669.1 hypothetical protein NVP1188B_15 [Vibrio phage 1.188.B._10N.286.51.A6]AUR93755.1 hypothetical protein NVP1188C_15 [Vibrio phage 1.188.C._10N.286.51.A6]AUR92046.1 hypothetical protein NVP1169O_18 [Vibrio phage 1.169.O._10N.261.52.B1]AUR93583.1 hypothetical protein NVP1188A_15 [Vibrio phage 1.188.A._10N.286.51.A6]